MSLRSRQFSRYGRPAYRSRNFRVAASRGSLSATRAVNQSSARAIGTAYRAYRFRRGLRTARRARLVRNNILRGIPRRLYM